MEKATLKALRINKGLTLEQASKELGINIVTLSSYENARTFPDVQTINKILDLYNTSYDNINFLCN
jgi:transcriptional regulator with XRE-family HTH domain